VEVERKREKLKLILSRKNMLEYILAIGVDGVITDYPHEFRETLERFHPDRQLAPKGDEERVRGCLRKHIQVTGSNLPSLGYESESE
jgi:hypothetical protein